MQIKETSGLSFPGSVESPPLEDVVVLVDSCACRKSNPEILVV